MSQESTAVVKDNDSSAESDSEFCFETDHPRLKKNPDYLKLMKTIAVLEYQRVLCAQNYEQLCKLRKLNDEDPDLFKEKLSRGELNIPDRIKVAKLPEIDWDKYNISKNADGTLRSLEPKFRPQTRQKNIGSDNEEVAQKKTDKLLVRGREFDETKPETFNQLWTAEEQCRLEQLLLEFPPERKESRRWVKIANALGNRTPKQVCSRVQKYFLKLRKAGLAVPGRSPRSSAYKSAKVKKNLNIPTTFFPNIYLESKLLNYNESEKNLQCDDDDDDDNGDDNYNDNDGDDEDNNDIDESDKEDVKEYSLKMDEDESEEDGEETEKIDKRMTDRRLLEILVKVRNEKSSPTTLLKKHYVPCTNCRKLPIIGTRWSCTKCKAMDLCSDCFIAIIYGEQKMFSHPMHHLNAVEFLDTFRDPDYSPESFSSANYLDPNYLPE